MLGYTNFSEAAKAEKVFMAGKDLRGIWAGTLREVLKELPPETFGKHTRLDWKKAAYSTYKNFNVIEVPITGRSAARAHGLLRPREVTGRVFIRGSKNGFTHIYMWDAKPECRAVAWAGEPTREDIKRQLLIERKRPEHNPS